MHLERSEVWVMIINPMGLPRYLNMRLALILYSCILIISGCGNSETRHERQLRDLINNVSMVYSSKQLKAWASSYLSNTNIQIGHVENKDIPIILIDKNKRFRSPSWVLITKSPYGNINRIVIEYEGSFRLSGIIVDLNESELFGTERFVILKWDDGVYAYIAK